MGKDLPWFKFYTAEWLSSKTELLELLTKGVFIDVCAYYWHNECKLERSILNRKYKDYHTEIERLITDEKLIKVDNGYIKISFLDEQYKERLKKSITNTINGRKGGRPKNKPNASVSVSESKPNDNQYRREEKIGEEMKKEDKIEIDILYTTYINDESLIKINAEKHKVENSVIVNKLKAFGNHLKGQGISKYTLSEYNKHFYNWLNLDKNKPISRRKRYNVI